MKTFSETTSMNQDHNQRKHETHLQQKQQENTLTKPNELIYHCQQCTPIKTNLNNIKFPEQRTHL